MNEFKYRIFNLFFFFLLLGSSYWAFQHIDTKVLYRADDVIEEDASLENQEVSEDMGTPEVQEQIPEGGGDKFLVLEEEEKNNEISLSEEEKELIAQLQKLIDDKIYMKKGSRGTRVGTVQKFLNLYLDKETRVDNDYGPQTIERVRQFQQEEGLDADGMAGPQTYAKMIEVLESGKLS